MNIHQPTTAPQKANHSRRVRRRRKGVAATECAICLPIVLTLTLVTLEFTSAIFLKETVTIAAYEGARVGVQRRSTNQDAEDQIQRVLDARGIQGATITVGPGDITRLSALDIVTVDVSAPVAGNSFFMGQFLEGRNVTATVQMRREFDN